MRASSIGLGYRRGVDHLVWSIDGLTFHRSPFNRGKWYRDTAKQVRKLGPLTKTEMANQQQRLDETFQQVGCWTNK